MSTQPPQQATRVRSVASARSSVGRPRLLERRPTGAVRVGGAEPAEGFLHGELRSSRSTAFDLRLREAVADNSL